MHFKFLDGLGIKSNLTFIQTFCCQRQYLLCDSKRLFWRFKSSISCWWEVFLRRINCIYSAAFLSICALLATFSPCNAGTESLRLEKLSLMWSLLLRSNALWCARFSAWKHNVLYIVQFKLITQNQITSLYRNLIFKLCYFRHIILRGKLISGKRLPNLNNINTWHLRKQNLFVR